MLCNSKHSIKQSAGGLLELLSSTEQLITGSWPEYNGLSYFVKENILITFVQTNFSLSQLDTVVDLKLKVLKKVC